MTTRARLCEEDRDGEHERPRRALLRLGLADSHANRWSLHRARSALQGGTLLSQWRGEDHEVVRALVGELER